MGLICVWRLTVDPDLVSIESRRVDQYRGDGSLLAGTADDPDAAHYEDWTSMVARDVLGAAEAWG